MPEALEKTLGVLTCALLSFPTPVGPSVSGKMEDASIPGCVYLGVLRRVDGQGAEASPEPPRDAFLSQARQ